MTTQYVTDKKGNKVAVILPLEKYRELLEAQEELEDIKLYDKAQEENLKFMDAEEAFEDIERIRKNKNVQG